MSLRAGGFPEYNPQEQQLFDALYEIIQKNYESFGYQHIWTPSVEKNDVLKKGGGEVANQIFGLYGLAQGGEDLKDYSLHFDLTVPFARYVLDWQNDLAFPFKRYQIQPVWRGERSQKGRFKEFRQADIDAIWRGENHEINKFYDAEIILILIKTLSHILHYVGVDQTLVLKINNKKMSEGFIDYIIAKFKFGSSEQLLSLFDKYYKLGDEKFQSELLKIGYSEENISEIVKYIRGFYIDISVFDWLGIDGKFNDKFESGRMELDDVIGNIREISRSLGVQYKLQFDPTIVRGLDYYTGTVFETFIEGKTELGSICSGGSYANFTDFLDKKQSFSGMGGSIGLSRLMSILVDDFKIDIDSLPKKSKKMMCLNFAATFNHILKLADHYRNQGLGVDIYPVEDKFAKQLQYADKKGFDEVLILGEDELKANVYKIKDLKSGIEKSADIKSIGLMDLI